MANRHKWRRNSTVKSVSANYPVIMLCAEGAGECVSASLRLTSPASAKIMQATVDWNCASPTPSSVVSVQGGESHWEQLSMVVSAAFGTNRARGTSALEASSWELAQVYLHSRTKKVSQTVRISVFRRDWCAEFLFPGSRRSGEYIEIPAEYRHLDVGELLGCLMRNRLSFKIFL